MGRHRRAHGGLRPGAAGLCRRRGARSPDARRRGAVRLRPARRGAQRLDRRPARHDARWRLRHADPGCTRPAQRGARRRPGARPGAPRRHPARLDSGHPRPAIQRGADRPERVRRLEQYVPELRAVARARRRPRGARHRPGLQHPRARGQVGDGPQEPGPPDHRAGGAGPHPGAHARRQEPGAAQLRAVRDRQPQPQPVGDQRGGDQAGHHCRRQRRSRDRRAAGHHQRRPHRHRQGWRPGNPHPGQRRPAA